MENKPNNIRLQWQFVLVLCSPQTSEVHHNGRWLSWCFSTKQVGNIAKIPVSRNPVNLLSAHLEKTVAKMMIFESKCTRKATFMQKKAWELLFFHHLGLSDGMAD